MQIVSLDLHNFRCFKKLHLDFNSNIVLITGPNGTGKTSILEALNYSCYLRSFKTHITKELINLNANNFLISTNIANNYAFDVLQISFEHDKRSVKLNQKTIQSFKELYNTFKVITISSDDLDIIQGSPLLRRSFIDQLILFIDISFATLLRNYTQILENRNALLFNYNKSKDLESYILWTNQLFAASKLIEKKRIEMLEILNREINEIISNINLDTKPSIYYQNAKPYTKINELNSAQEIMDNYPNLLDNELRQQRTLFGAHLADFKIEFPVLTKAYPQQGQRTSTSTETLPDKSPDIQNKSSRIYASRGQQKLILFLLKLSQISYINKLNQNKNVILLIDDFFTDFDESKHDLLINLTYDLASQVILTAPLKKNFLEEKFKQFNPQIIELEINN